MQTQLSNDHKQVKIGDLDITVRPITPEDKDIEAEFVRGLSTHTKYERFFEAIRELSPSMLNVFCNIDYVKTMAYVATIQKDGKEKEIGVCRYAADEKLRECEMAVTVADEYAFQDIASILLESLIKHAKANNVDELYSVELSTNEKMHTLAQHFGMTAKSHPSDHTLVLYTLTLH